MLKYIFIFSLIFIGISNICEAHRVDGEWHTNYIVGHIANSKEKPRGAEEWKHKHDGGGGSSGITAYNPHKEYHGGNGAHANAGSSRNPWHWSCVQDDNGRYHRHDEANSDQKAAGTGTFDEACPSKGRPGTHTAPINNNPPPNPRTYTPPTGDDNPPNPKITDDNPPNPRIRDNNPPSGDNNPSAEDNSLRSDNNVNPWVRTPPNNVVTPPEPVIPVSFYRFILVTEYMMRDGGGRSLPVWIELYNSSNSAISLQGYTFTYATRKFANSPWDFIPHTIGNFSIPAKSAVILASKSAGSRAWNVAGISSDQVYILGVPERPLKSGWLITDGNDNEVHRVGRAFRTAFHLAVGDVQLKGSWQKRASYHRYAGSTPDGSYYYGHQSDTSHPGFHESARLSPSLIKRTKIDTWANLKKQYK